MPESRSSRLAAARTGRLIQDEIMQLILDRRLHPGDPLPTEMELVHQFEVSRNSVREALRALQALDIVEIRHGYGTYVGGLSLQPLTNGLTFRTLEGLSRDTRALRELLDVREALEDGLIRRVTSFIPDTDLALLDQIVTRMDAKAQAHEDFAEEDREFHEVLYRCLDNPLVVQLLRTFWEVFHRINHQLGRSNPDPIETARRHRAIVTALRSGKPKSAQNAMTKHFRNIDASVDQLTTPDLSGSPPL